MGLVAGIFWHESDATDNKIFPKLKEIFSRNASRKLDVYKQKNFIMCYLASGVEDFLEYQDSKESLSYYTGYTVIDRDRPRLKRLESFANRYKDPELTRQAHNFLRCHLNNQCVEFESDILGSVPLYYRLIDDQLVFCSEFEVLANIFTEKLSYDEVAISHFYSSGVMLPGETFYKEIRSVLPGKIHQFTRKGGNKAVHEQILDTQYQPPDYTKLGLREFASSMKDKLEVIVNTFISDFDIDEMRLTGGADTRLTLAMMSQENRKNIKFKTMSHKLPSLRSYYDVEVAKLLSEKLGLSHEILIDESSGVTFSNFFRRYYPLEKVFLGGVYGGEFFGGQSVPAMPIYSQSNDFRGILQSLEIFSFETNENCMDEYNQWICSGDVYSKEYYNSVLTFRNSSLTSIYEGDLHWAGPALNAFRRFSMFNMGEVLWELCNVPFEYIKNYLLYTEVFKQTEKSFQEIPFDSLIARTLYTPFKDIQHYSSIENSESLITKDVHMIRVKNVVENEMVSSELRKFDLFNYEKIEELRPKMDRSSDIRLVQLLFTLKRFGAHRDPEFFERLTSDVEKQANNF